MIARLFGCTVLFSAVVAFSGCASIQESKSIEFQTRPKPGDLMCSSDKVTVKVTPGSGLAPENSFLAQMESAVSDAINTRKKYSPCVTTVPRNYTLDIKITRLTADGKLAGLLSPAIDQVFFDGDFVLRAATPANDTLAMFSMKNTFSWGCSIKNAQRLWGIFANANGQGGECGSAASLVLIEDIFAEDIAGEIVVTPVPPPKPAADAAATGKQGDGKTDDKSAKDKPAATK